MWSYAFSFTPLHKINYTYMHANSTFKYHSPTKTHFRWSHLPSPWLYPLPPCFHWGWNQFQHTRAFSPPPWIIFLDASAATSLRCSFQHPSTPNASTGSHRRTDFYVFPLSFDLLHGLMELFHDVHLRFFGETMNYFLHLLVQRIWLCPCKSGVLTRGYSCRWRCSITRRLYVWQASLFMGLILRLYLCPNDIHWHPKMKI